jgi:hypothetical protein
MAAYIEDGTTGVCEMIRIIKLEGIIDRGKKKMK